MSENRRGDFWTHTVEAWRGQPEAARNDISRGHIPTMAL